ncbi:MAG: AAA family ATPase [Acidimicrobiales bacterium]
MTLSVSDVARSDEVDVVVLFTDIEDSTPKWETSFSSMSVALQRHDGILSDAVTLCHGRVLKHTGDGIVASFADVPAAIQAAIETQRRFAQEDFSAVGGLTVRMGIHAGRAEQRDGDLYGPTLNQCGRVMSAAHGGQVIATSAVASIVKHDYAPWCESAHVDFLDLGVHRFKGLSNPERLFQLTHPDLRSEFPSPRSHNALIGNLPPALESLFGRDALIAEVVDLLSHPSVVTLTGPAGVGKTSVALHVGQQLVDRFPDGVWVVDLSLVTDGAGVAVAIAQTLGIAPRLGQSLEETLKDALGVRRALIILDNAQRPREGVATCINQVIVHGSLVRILTTSFSTVGVGGEVRVRVAPLDVPEALDVRILEDARQWPAVQLFVDRARAVSSRFALSETNLSAVVSICERLDGLPLAIELAAARVELLSPQQIAARLSQRFQLLHTTSGPVGRHQALDTTLAWSVELLSDETKELFMCLGAVASSFDLETACAVASRDEYDTMNRLSELAANSLLVIDVRDDDVRYRMLESLRLFAEEQLEAEDFLEEVRERHARHFGDFAARMRGSMWGMGGLELVDEGLRSLADLRRAFDFYLAHDPGSALKMATDLYALWILRDLAAEGVSWFGDIVRVLGGIEHAEPTSALVAGLDDAGTLAWMIGEQALADHYLQACLGMAARLGQEDPPKALIRIGTIKWLAGDDDEGRRMCRRALELSQAGDEETQMVVERTLGAVLSLCGDREEGAAIGLRAVERARRTDLWLTSALTNYVWSCFTLDANAAVTAAREAVLEATKLKSSYYLGGAWAGLALAHWELGDVAGSCHAWAEAIENQLNSGAKSNVLVSLGRMSDAMLDTAPEIATTLVAGAARQPGPGSDGTWQEIRYEMLKKRLGDEFSDERFAVAWQKGVELSIDSLVRVARAAVDEIFPPTA